MFPRLFQSVKTLQLPEKVSEHLLTMTAAGHTGEVVQAASPRNARLPAWGREAEERSEYLFLTDTHTVSSLCGLSYSLKQLYYLKLRQRKLENNVLCVIKAEKPQIQR